MEKAIVRKGYIVYFQSKRYSEGMEIPSAILPTVLANQSWKVEVKEDAKSKEKERAEEGEKTESGTTGEWKEEKIIDRAIKKESTIRK